MTMIDIHTWLQALLLHKSSAFLREEYGNILFLYDTIGEANALRALDARWKRERPDEHRHATQDSVTYHRFAQQQQFSTSTNKQEQPPRPRRWSDATNTYTLCGVYFNSLCSLGIHSRPLRDRRWIASTRHWCWVISGTSGRQQKPSQVSTSSTMSRTGCFCSRIGHGTCLAAANV